MKENHFTEEQQDMVDTLTKALPLLRKELNISQTELAEKVGISRQMISLIERQLQPMTWTQFLAIVFFFKCNNDFDAEENRIAKKHPNVVEKIMLLGRKMKHEDD